VADKVDKSIKTDDGVYVEYKGRNAFLSTKITPQLTAEGDLNDLRHIINQKIRKQQGFKVDDVVTLWIETDDYMKSLIVQNTEILKLETMSDYIYLRLLKDGNYESFTINNHPVKIMAELFKAGISGLSSYED